MLGNLDKYHVVLASNSPRRKELLGGLGIPYEVRTIDGIDESYPNNLSGEEIPVYISSKKAEAYLDTMRDDDLIITADTIVWIDNQVLGKPKDEADAKRMLLLLSGRIHKVITGVTLITRNVRKSFSVTSEVEFAVLTEDEIDYYVKTFRPLDKAGAYGIQDKGSIFVEKIEGDFFTVMGFPIERFMERLAEIGIKLKDIAKI